MPGHPLTVDPTADPPVGPLVNLGPASAAPRTVAPGLWTARRRAGLWTTRGAARAREIAPVTSPCPTFARMGADQRAEGESLPDDPAAIEKIIDARRRHLAETVDELVVRAHPKEIARRTTADATARARGFVLDGSGNPRYERIAALGAAVVLVAVLVVLRRRSGGD
jgi:hypothetical protein